MQTHKRYSIGHASFEAEPLKAGLYVTATPIGNLADVTLRALAVLAAADRILCEDTRVTARLLQRYGIRTTMTAYHDFNGAKLRPGLVADIKAGASLALVSDAGMPLVSDPGYKLVRAVIAEGLAVDVVPGPSATLTALALSGLPSDRFLYGGFVPEKAGERARVLDELGRAGATMIFFDSPHRIVETLRGLGTRPVAVARELTKLYEEVLRGPADDIAAALAARETIKGEITLVIAAPEPRGNVSDDDLDSMLKHLSKSMPASAAAAEAARETGRPKKELYARLLALKDG